MVGYLSWQELQTKRLIDVHRFEARILIAANDPCSSICSVKLLKLDNCQILCKPGDINGNVPEQMQEKF